MRQVGLPAHVDDDDDVDPMIALLQMLTVALGIRVPRELALGPLLTVQREKAPPRPPIHPAGRGAGRADPAPRATAARQLRPQNPKTGLTE
jgi:hypothetical protein